MLSNVGTAIAAGISLLALYVYTSRRAYTYRYLFPGLAAIAIFIVLPMLYTVWLGFTNYSSAHLLTFERATDVLLSETYQVDSARYQFSLHRDGDAFRIILRTGDDDAPADGTANVANDSMLDSAPAAGSGEAGSANGSAPPPPPPPHAHT